MEPPSLTLQILQGPPHCDGKTLEFKPGSAIRIGRVVRGNNLPIKDPGISSKHLCIVTESGKWVLRDLDSSNGTVLNGSGVSPQTPFPLHDGSTIKIGELTSILVNFVQPNRTEPEPGPEAEGTDAPVAKPGRGRRGKGLKGKVVIQSIDENAVVNVGDESVCVDRPESKRVTRNSKNNRSGVRVSDSSAGKVEEPKNTRATRNSKNRKAVIEILDSSDGNSDAPEEEVEELRNSRVARNSKNPSSLVENAEKKKTDSLDSDAPEEKVEGPRIMRAKRNLKNAQASSLQVEMENAEKKKTDNLDLDAPEEKVEEPRIMRAKRNLKNAQASSSLQVEVENAEKKKTCVLNLDAPEEKVEEPRNTRATRNLTNKQGVIRDGAQGSSLQVGVENVEKKKTRGGGRRMKLLEECTGEGGVKENLNADRKETCEGREKENLNGGGNWPDLEKLSMGQWFDFLEVHLPKQIVDTTEEMFDSMRQKAERLREYIIMQKNQEVTVPVE